MKQRINLLPEREATKREISSLALTCAVLASILLVLIVGSVYLHSHAASRAQELASVQATLDTLPAKIEALEAERRAVTASPTLLRQQDVLLERIDSQRQLSELVNELDLDRYHSMSNYLLDMANATVQDAWLTRIRIDVVAQTAFLEGSANDPSRVPALIESLVSTQAFSSFGVSEFEVAQTERLHRFFLTASLKEKDGD
ncbi:MAG: PilN domain-containing protein [Pontibacterium sp.]